MPAHGDGDDPGGQHEGGGEPRDTVVLGLRVRERAGHDPQRIAAAVRAAVDGLARPTGR